MEVQVEHGHYASMEYNQKGRFSSYWHQIDEVLTLGSKTVLEIGTGNGIVNKALNDAGVAVSVLDIDAGLKPEYLGSVTSIPLGDEKFDAAICCQVLEHIPYEQFGTALSEIRRVVRKNLILSLPDLHRVYKVGIQLPFFGEWKFLYTIPRLRPLKWSFNGEHYWNISCEGYPLSRIKKDIINAGFTIDKMYCVHELPWHRFFILTKK